jgi:hypothetical protein
MQNIRNEEFADLSLKTFLTQRTQRRGAKIATAAVAIFQASFLARKNVKGCREEFPWQP